MGTELLTDTFCHLRRKLHIIALRILKDESEAQDAVQDAFCNLWAAKSPVTGDEARYRLFAVLKNVCLNKLRRRRDVTHVFPPGMFEEPVHHGDVERLKNELLRHLTSTQRTVFRLSVFEELEYAEIAEALGMSIETVRMNMSRARKTLREQYKKLKL